MKKYLPLALLLACAPFTASAGELNYNYVEAGYSKTHFDGFNIDGYAAKGSMAFNDQFYGAIGVHQDNEQGEYLEPWELTGGYRHGLSDNVDLVAEASYIGFNSKLGSTRYHNDGYRAAVGVRTALGKHFELGAKATWTDVENMNSVVGANVEALVKFNQTWGIYGQYHYREYNFFRNANNWQLGVRASF